jgi:hypothetical protein
MDKNIWDQFVKKNDGSVYQLYGWQNICREVFGYDPSPIVLTQNGAISGTFPGIKRGWQKNNFVSLPFVDWAGPVVTCGKSFRQLMSKISKQFSSWEVFSLLNFGFNIPVYQIFELAINSDYSTILAKVYHHKTRNMVSKGKRQEFGVDFRQLTVEDLPEFSSLYLKTMKKIGTLCLPLKIFPALLKEFSSHSFVSRVTFREKLVAGLWTFIFNQKIYVWANVSEEKFLSQGANYLAYDAVIKFAAENNFKAVILGASSVDSSQGFFKERWGAKAYPVFLYSSCPTVISRRWEFLKILKIFLKILPDSLYVKCSHLAWRFS